MKNAKHEFLKSKLESMEKAFQKLNSDFNDIREAMNDVTIIEPTNRYAIRKIICKHYRISEWEFSSKNRKREMADASYR
jgi:chromosomal replication initiation ATPase DnaA